MTPVTKQAWIDALRSGKYKRCTGALAKVQENGSTCYCCLGVLATLAGVPSKKHSQERPEPIMIFDFAGIPQAGVIPELFLQFIVSDLDLNQAVGDDSGEQLMLTLSGKNDNGATFEDIADYLETV